MTREQLAAMLYRYAAYKQLDVSARADLSGYADRSTVSAWAQTALEWANSTGLVTGKSSTKLDPTGNATRAELATMLQRFAQRLH